MDRAAPVCVCCITCTICFIRPQQRWLELELLNLLITDQTNESRSQMPNNGNEISEECVSAQSNWEKCNLESGTCSSGAPCGSFPALLWLHSRIRFGPEGALSSEGMKTHIILFCEVQESTSFYSFIFKLHKQRELVQYLRE
ncbi:hypothetical protein AOLI_G00264480 [Acnodon oligacanthus]